MTSILASGFTEIVTNDPAAGDGTKLGIIRNGAVVVENDMIRWVGEATTAPAADHGIDVSAQGIALIPGFVDSHSHLVFAGDRSAEFEARMAGIPYDGGGISTTVAATRAATDDELRGLVRSRVLDLGLLGTTTFEIKSGYGLTVEDEVRLLRIAREFTDETTFLGAHVVPSGSDRSSYVRLVSGEMLDACAPYAKWIDVFCEPASAHAFDADEARHVLAAGKAKGLGLRVHGNQLAHGPGVQLAVELGAASVDHCTYLTDADVGALAGSSTVATLLPGVEFATRSPYPDARRLIDAGVTVAIASDCNPGTCNSSSMPFMIALAVREMHLTPTEAVWAATAGGAKALRRDDVGVIRPGARADLLGVRGSHVDIAYRPGMPSVGRLSLPPVGSG